MPMNLPPCTQRSYNGTCMSPERPVSFIRSSKCILLAGDRRVACTVQLAEAEQKRRSTAQVKELWANHHKVAEVRRDIVHTSQPQRREVERRDTQSSDAPPAPAGWPYHQIAQVVEASRCETSHFTSGGGGDFGGGGASSSYSDSSSSSDSGSSSSCSSGD